MFGASSAMSDSVGTSSPVVVLSVNSAWNVVNFRSGLVRALRGCGYRVIVLAPEDRHAGRVRDLGCEFIHIPMSPRGVNPFGDLWLLWRYWICLRRVRPVVYLGFTIKPNIYGSFVARLLGIPAINNIAGLGATFLGKGAVNSVAKLLYRFALRGGVRVFFQNADDRALFERLGLVTEAQSALLPGSGVDLSRFCCLPSGGQGAVVFLLSARLLREKGVAEYVEAVRILRDRGVDCEARLLGFIDSTNSSAVRSEEIALWQSEGLITYLGESDDVRPIIAGADAVVLPSYYPEGTPRSLLEAAAMGRAIITTDTPGCRDVVLNGVSGFLVPARDPVALANAMEGFVSLSAEERSAMGLASRQLVEARYDERIVIDAYLSALSMDGCLD